MKCYSFVYCFICIIIIMGLNGCTISKKALIQEVVAIPSWVPKYYDSMSDTEKYFDNGYLEEFGNSENMIKVIHSNGKYSLYYYYKDIYITKIVDSKIGFYHGQWGKKHDAFIILKLTHVGDFVYNGDLLVYKVNKKQISQLFIKKGNRSNAAGFANKSNRLAYGCNGSIIIYSIDKKRENVIKIAPEYSGNFSSISWNENDNEIFVTYVTPIKTKYFIISNID